MSYDQIYRIASQAISLEKLRIDLIANNIAHQYSLPNAKGDLYQVMHAVSTTAPFDRLIPERLEKNQVNLVTSHLPPNRVYQPGHPAADKMGYVSYPGISMIDEMSQLIRASRAYEANIKIIKSAHSLYLQSLTIGDEK